MKVRIPARRTRRTLAVVAILAMLPVAMSQSGTAAASRRATAHGPNGKAAKARYSATPRMFTLQHGAGEPTLGITKQGEVFVTLSSGCVTSCTGEPQMLETVKPGERVIWASSDKGRTWRDVSPGEHTTGASPHAFSLDPYILVDEHPDGDRIFDMDLTLACAILSYSDDRGASWITNPLACGEPVNDHQTLFAGKPRTSTTIGYPHVLYYCFNHPAITKCTKSINGGLTFVPTAQIQAPACGGLNGHGIVGRTGIVYVPLGSCGKPSLAISKDEGNTWNVVQIHDEITADGDPSVAADKAGNLYYLWNDGVDRKPWLSTSTNGGKTWSKPVMVAPKGVDETNLATLAVGAPGKVAIAYYGTTNADNKKLGWSGYIASGVDVLGSKPTFYTATVNNPRNPLKMGECGTRGSNRCGRVLDFIDVEIAPDGTPWGAYVDACLATCEKSKEESYADNLGVVGNLVGGPNLMR
ncbi:MAG TPA: sialidase family protein [Frankiaceae bacterium]|nr:sialidase family protein [Frankiaceae bacterium]